MRQTKLIFTALIMAALVAIGMSAPAAAVSAVPTDVQVYYSAGSDQAALTWSNPSSADWDSVQVFIKRNYGEWLKYGSETISTSATISGLYNGVYYFAVAAVQGNQHGALVEPSSWITVTGVQTAPSEPRFFLASREGATVTFSWTHPADVGSGILGYRIYEEDDPEYVIIADVPANQISATTALNFRGVHRYVIIAYTAHGFGDSSYVATVFYGNPPGEPRNVSASITGSQLVATWNRSAGTGQYYEDELQYRIQVRHDGGAWTTAAEVLASTLTASIDLSESGTYQVRVISLSEFGESDPATSDQLIWLAPGGGGTTDDSPISQITDGVAVVDPQVAAGAGKEVSKLGMRPKRAPVTKAKVGTTVAIKVTGLDAKKRYRAQLQAKARWLAVGPFRTDGSGSGTLPVIACTKAGKNVLRVADPGGKVAGFLVLRCM